MLIYHFMFGPSYADGCPVNSSIADAFDSLIPHLKARDVSFIAVSGAPIEKLLGYRERMGWGFNCGLQLSERFPAALSETAIGVTIHNALHRDCLNADPPRCP